MIVNGALERGQKIIQNLKNGSNFNSFPSNEDFDGVATGLLRLQVTYKLDTANLAKGFINHETKMSLPSKKKNIKKKIELKSGDCFELGKTSYINGDYYHAVLWMQEALDRYEKEEPKTADKADILEYFAFSFYKLGNIKQALKLTKDLVILVPNHPRASSNLVYYQKLIQNSNQINLKGDIGDEAPLEDAILSSDKIWPKKKIHKNYESLCRGEVKVDLNRESKLICYFMNTRDRFYTRLMRIKIEEAYKNPYIIIYHDVLSDNEIDEIKKLALPLMSRATIQNPVTGLSEIVDYRVSKSAWLMDKDSEVVARVIRRIGEFSKLSVKSAELLQVANYGIGGQYEPHYDYARPGEKVAFKNGNRIATWLNYMSDVEAGGATAFIDLGISLKPKKGSAAFWFNLYPNGEGNLLTLHAACPVLLGSKWVSNIWFHEREQEFVRPCGLKFDDI